MYFHRDGLIIGFHGCDKSIQEKVLLGETELIPSNNSWDWLGSGIYFWENNADRAFHFAKEQSKRKNSKIKNPAVIGAVFNLGVCLDLMDMRSLLLVKESHKSLVELTIKSGGVLPVNIKSEKFGNIDLLQRHLIVQ